MSLSNNFLLLMVVVSVAALDPVSAIAQGLKGDPELLVSASKAHRANLDKLKQWKGEVQAIRRDQQKSDPVETLDQEAWITFAEDKETAKSRSNIKMLKDNLVIDPKLSPVRRTRLTSRNYLRLDSSIYELQLSADSEKTRRTAYLRPRRNLNPGYLLHSFDPFYFFTGDGTEYEATWKFYVTEAKTPTINASVAKDNNMVTLAVRMDDPASQLESTTIIDMSLGGNVVSHADRAIYASSTSETKFVWKWEKINGVFVPTLATKHYTVTGAQPTNNYVEFVWTKNIVNEPMDEKEFSFSTLGLRDGEQIRDNKDKLVETVADKAAKK